MFSSKASGRAIVMGNNHGIVVTGTVSGDVKQTIDGTPLVELHQPWLRQPDPENTAALLTWKSRIPKTLYGRDSEMAKLVEWAESDYPLKVRLIYGESGVGKTRLAFELAAKLAEKPGWLAGQVNSPDDLVAYPLGDKGTLLVIDYPEEKERAVLDFMRRLSYMEEPQDTRIRILLLARREEANTLADDLCDRRDMPLSLNRLTTDQDEQAWRLFSEGFETIQTIRKQDTTTKPLDQPSFLEWLTSHPLHRRPLFLLAFALHISDQPETARLQGPDIISTLVDREIIRLKREIDGLNQLRRTTGESPIQAEAIVLLKALAGITGKLSRSAIEALQAVKLDDIQIPPFRDLLKTSIWQKGVLPALEPDLLAAQYLESVLNHETMSAGHWLYHTLMTQHNEALQESMSRFGRLQFDYRHILMQDERSNEPDAYPLISQLSKMLMTDPVLCSELEPAVSKKHLESSLSPLAVTIYRTLLYGLDDEARQAKYRQKLSIRLVEIGDRAGGLSEIIQAVAIYEKLIEEDLATYSPELAVSLNHLSIRLAESGDQEGGLKAISRAVTIFEKLSGENFDAYGPDLAASLNNKAIRLAAAGDKDSGIVAIKRAVEIFEQFADKSFAIYGSDLAQSLNNLSLRLAERNDNSDALEVISRALVIFERLAEDNFATYGAALASCLNNSSIRLAEAGNLAGALDTIRRAVSIREKLSKDNYDAYAPYLAQSLNNLSNRLDECGDRIGGLAVIRRAMEIIEPFAEPGSLYKDWFHGMIQNLKIKEDKAG